MTKFYFTVLLTLFQFSIFAQQDTSHTVTFGGYLEAYYSYDLGNPSDHERPDFFYSFDRHNEINVNIAFIKASYSHKNVKANLELMTGTYAKANLAHEPQIYRMINEASVSFQPFKNRKGWITAGIFPSHLGFESSVGADCYNLSRSLSAENSPYYLVGVKYETKSVNEQWEFGITLTNGWQRIRRINGNQLISGGHQLVYKPSEKIKLNSSSFIGSEFPDSTRKMRYFHNFYTEIVPTEKFSFTFGFDIGFQQKQKHGKDFSMWYTPTLITKLELTDKITLGARVEYYSDPDEVIISTYDSNGFETFGGSINFDYFFNDNLLFRIEARTLQNDRSIYFDANNEPTRNNTFLTTSLSVRF